MNLVFLAQRIREIRKKRQLTLDQVASRADLTPSLLSKIENFRATPSLSGLGRIAEALGVTMAELMTGVDERRPLVIVPKAERQVVERDRPKSSILYHSLASTRHAKLMEPLLLEVPPGEPRKEPLPHEGEEFIMVVEGTVELEYGKERHRLEQGDCAYLDASEPHRLINPGQTKATVLCVFSGNNLH
jgi:transcriptional regulator with XRE-family HTH domain